ncbi:hypothetical protein HPB48_017578 [Haemaphysalis longicornis]|uniref:Zinc finger PHD-type domain-containing protein n=1 Tax=Haemaphysalis longicornis TaxID=44386 RepID=A0A9J6GJV3_HAELO|nr:hypothetical protein HPB48_017578 [Haemaphysalis longicornis]
MAGDEMCTACQIALLDDGRFMKCSDCNNFYHLGQNCSGIAPNTFTTMGQGKRDVWVCKTCRASKKRQGPNSQPDVVPEVEWPDSEAAVLSELWSIRKSLEMLPALHEKVESLLLLKVEFAGLSAQVNDLGDKVSFMSSQHDTVLAESKGCHEQVSRCAKEVEDLKPSVHEQAAGIERLHDELNDTEHYSRRANLEIHGMPVEQEEDLQKNSLISLINWTYQTFPLLMCLACTGFPASVTQRLPFLCDLLPSAAPKGGWQHAANYACYIGQARCRNCF